MKVVHSAIALQAQDVIRLSVDCVHWGHLQIYFVLFSM